MDVIKNFVKRNMARNRKRTIVTIIGVMLSAALMCAVAGMAATFREGMLDYYRTMYGSFYGKAENVPVEKLSYITDNAHVTRAGISLAVGAAMSPCADADAQDTYEGNPYIYIMAFDDTAFEDVALNVVEGRLPENDTELLVNELAMPDDWKVGDKVTLNVGHRELFGEDVAIEGSYFNKERIIEDIQYSMSEAGSTEKINTEDIEGDHITDTVPREYTIVGVMQSPNNLVQVFGRGGFICLTRMKDLDTFSAYRDTDVFTANVYYTFDSAMKYGDYNAKLIEMLNVATDWYDESDAASEGAEEGDATDSGETADGQDNDGTVKNDRAGNDETENDETENDKADNNEIASIAKLYMDSIKPGVSTQRNDLVKFLGGVGDTAAAAVEALAAIIIAIIVVTSVFVISNSFRISVSEKKIQLGMLSSIGATKRQIKKIVLKEGMYIGVIGTTLGIILGVVVVAILTVIVQKLIGDIMMMTFRFVFPWWVVAIVIVMSAVTIYFSCIIPAISAARISPIEAIRGNCEIKLKGRKLKTGWFTRKLFGIGGVIASKNLKRSRRSYRTTVVSLVIGVAAFIALATFLDYGKRLSVMMYGDWGYDISITDSGGTNEQQMQRLKEYEKLSGIEGVNDYAIIREMAVAVPLNVVDDNFRSSTDEEHWGMDVVACDRASFARYLKEINVAADPAEAVILVDDTMMANDDNSYEKYRFLTSKEGDVLSVTSDIFGDNEDARQAAGEIYTKDMQITKVTDKMPMGLRWSNYGGYLIVGEDYFGDKLPDGLDIIGMYFNTDTPDEVIESISDMLKSDGVRSDFYIENIAKDRSDMENLMLLIAIFLYGFIIVTMLIAVTNVFNTIHTNMNLRAKEFAMLKSVGMTGHEFNRMIRLESIMYGARSLIIGIPLGTILSYGIYKAIAKEADFGYALPFVPMLISMVFVAIVVWITMHFSLARIKKQNIIETIRKQTY